MEVILREDYPALGFIGDKIKVRNGYARNFLIPNGLAVESNSTNAGKINHQLRQINAARAKKKQEAEARSAQLSALSVTIKIKLGENGKAFGSVTSKEVADALKQQADIVIDRKQIVLAESMRTVGTYSATCKLHSEVSAKFSVVVESDVEKRAEVAPAAEVE